MRTKRFFLGESQIKNGQASLVGREYHHLKHVLRMQPGDEFEALDGKGHIYKAKITTMSDKEALCELSSPQEVLREDVLQVSLMVSVVQEKAMSVILQKLTELGVFSIYPVLSERSSQTIRPEDYEKKEERWLRIIQDAAKQSGNPVLPILHPIVPFSQFDWRKERTFFTDWLYLTPLGEERWTALWNHVQGSNQDHQILMAIGPEGGWSQAEEADFQKRGFWPMAFGDRILRAETAAVAAASVVHLWNLMIDR